MKISIRDFDFTFAGYGHYVVTYTSPKTGKQWSVKTNDMQLIDATRGAFYAKQKDLDSLKRVCKS